MRRMIVFLAMAMFFAIDVAAQDSLVVTETQKTDSLNPYIVTWQLLNDLTLLLIQVFKGILPAE